MRIQATLLLSGLSFSLEGEGEGEGEGEREMEGEGEGDGEGEGEGDGEGEGEREGEGEGEGGEGREGVPRKIELDHIFSCCNVTFILHILTFEKYPTIWQPCLSTSVRM